MSWFSRWARDNAKKWWIQHGRSWLDAESRKLGLPEDARIVACNLVEAAIIRLIEHI